MVQLPYKKVKVLLVVLASVIMALLSFHRDRSFLGAEGKRPRMVASGTEFDFGKVSQWDILEHTFVVRNEGEGDLRIENVSPD